MDSWPMIIFTVLGQLSVGAILMLGIGNLWTARKHGDTAADRVATQTLWLVGGTLLLGFIATPFHLGQPLAAYRAINNFGSSWLSNEFIGPGAPKAALWESVHTTGELLLFQPGTRQVRAWYHRFGMAATDEGSEPDDHLGLEFAFLGALAAQAAQAEEPEEWESLRLASAEFWQAHPGRWVRRWAELVHEHAEHPFNQGLGRLIAGIARTMDRVHGEAMPLPDAASR